MWDLALVVARTAHIAAGVVAAFVVFPIQALNTKGSRNHQRFGRAGLVLSVVIALTGFLMLVNPLFASFWSSEAEVLGWSGFFHETFYEPAFFLWLDVILLYLVFAATRAWTRATAPEGKRTAPIDFLLTLVAAAFSLGYLTIGVVDLHRVDRYGAYMVATAVVVLLFVIWDVATFVRPDRPRKWWLYHALRVFVAWGGLLLAVLIRYDALGPDARAVHDAVFVAWLAICFVAVHRWNRRQGLDRVEERAASVSGGPGDSVS